VRFSSSSLIIAVASLSFAPAHAFNCQQIGQFIDAYVRMHYAADAFDDELSARTLENFVSALDPGKMYFLKSDMEQLETTFANRLDDYIKSGNCRALNITLGGYARRFSTRQPMIRELIDREHDFSIEESIDIDRKKRLYAADAEEIDERWRLQIKYQLMRLNKSFENMEEAREKLHKRYDLAEKYLGELDAIEIASIFLNAFSTALDPHSTYLSPEVLEDFRISTGLSLEGIGAVLRSEYGMTTVQSLVPGGPAEKGGLLKVGDMIVMVAQDGEEPVDVTDTKLRDVVKHIRGSRGSRVVLTVEREEKDENVQLAVAIVRDTIELTDREAKAYSYEVEVHEADETRTGYKIGLIRLPSFYIDFEGRKNGDPDYKSCSVDVERLIGELKEEKIDSLVIDLRYNSGGSLDEAIAIAGLFFDDGPVVQVKNSNGSKQVLSDKDSRTVYDGPLMVLINRHSASSSEIFAGAIQDYARGLIIGDSHSFGKGTVQKVNEIKKGDLGAMKVTIRQFFRPGGESTQLRGVEADIVLPDLVDEHKVGEEYYDHVLPWNQIESAEFAGFDAVLPFLEALKAVSSLRVQADEDFVKVLQDIEEYREKKDTRTLVSLKIEDDEETPDEDASGADAGDDLAETVESGEASEPEGADPDTDPDSKPDGKEPGAGDGELADKKRPALDKDIVLREALAIAADYLQIANDRQLASVSYPELDGYMIALGENDGTPTDLAEENAVAPSTE